jgi:hypothetical protein
MSSRFRSELSANPEILRLQLDEMRQWKEAFDRLRLHLSAITAALDWAARKGVGVDGFIDKVTEFRLANPFPAAPTLALLMEPAHFWQMLRSLPNPEAIAFSTKLLEELGDLNTIEGRRNLLYFISSILNRIVSPTLDQGIRTAVGMLHGPIDPAQSDAGIRRDSTVPSAAIPADNAGETLSLDARKLLRTLVDNNATSEEDAVVLGDALDWAGIGNRSGRPARRAIDELKGLKAVETRDGARGGVWTTDTGRMIAASMMSAYRT